MTASEIESSNKKEIVNLLSQPKIIELKQNYPDLNNMLKEWLGEKYDQIFPKKESNNQNQQTNNSSKQNILLTNYNNAQNKIEFFNSITNMTDKQQLFNQLPKTDKQEILNNKNTSFINYFYSNTENKNELLNLMNNETIQTLYSSVSNQDRQFISNYLHINERNLNNTIKQNVNNINTENKNIGNYNQNIINAKNNITNLKNNKQEIKLNIKNSKIVIKSLNKRKKNLEKKLTNTILKKESRITFINKRRLAKITKLTNELNLTNSSLENTENKINSLNKELNQTNKKIENEKNNIKKNKQNIQNSYQNMKDISRQIKNTQIEIKQLSSFHKQLIGKKIYSHSKSDLIITVPKKKIVNFENAVQQKEKTIKPTNISTPIQTNMSHQNINVPHQITNIFQQKQNIQNQPKKQSIPNQDKIISLADRKAKISNQQQPSITSQQQQKLEKEFNDLGINYNYNNYIDKQQNANFLPQSITHLSKKESEIMQLYYESQYYKKMAEMIKLQQQLSMNGQTRTLSKSGFSNLIIFILSLTILTLMSILMFLILK